MEISRRFSGSGMATAPFDTSTQENPTSAAQARHRSTTPAAQAASSKVPPTQARTAARCRISTFSPASGST
jgi:hypothetical protein